MRNFQVSLKWRLEPLYTKHLLFKNIDRELHLKYILKLFCLQVRLLFTCVRQETREVSKPFNFSYRLQCCRCQYIHLTSGCWNLRRMPISNDSLGYLRFHSPLLFRDHLRIPIRCSARAWSLWTRKFHSDWRSQRRPLGEALLWSVLSTHRKRPGP